MGVHRRELLYLAAGGAVLPFVWQCAGTQTYPTGSIRILVGFPAGGPVDIAARLISPWLSEQFGQPFVVENLPGESGNLATKAVVNARPDGSTLLLCGPVNTINTTLFQNLGFDFSRDIAPVASLFSVPLVVEVNPSFPAQTVPEFLALAKSQPGRIEVGYAGRGTPQHSPPNSLANIVSALVAGIQYCCIGRSIAQRSRGWERGMSSRLARLTLAGSTKGMSGLLPWNSSASVMIWRRG